MKVDVRRLILKIITPVVGVACIVSLMTLGVVLAIYFEFVGFGC